MIYKHKLELTLEDIQYLHDLAGRSMYDCKEAIKETDGNTIEAIFLLLKSGIPAVAWAKKEDEEKFLSKFPGWTQIINKLEFPEEYKRLIKYLHFKCPHCQKVIEVPVLEKDYIICKTGETKLIQEIFPYLSRGERELFLSGICSDCFDAIFSEDDE